VLRTGKKFLLRVCYKPGDYDYDKRNITVVVLTYIIRNG
jgi:hypothetical protein